MSSSPLISVNLAVYNAASYLAATLESILVQTLENFECLIVDDGSTDGSRAILQRYVDRDPRLRLWYNPNQGVSKSRNQLLAASRGELIAVMDADDIALPHRFALQAAFLQSHPDHVCVGGAHDLIDHRGRYLTCLRLPETNGEIQSLALAGHGSICHPCAMVRRSALEAVGGYDVSLRSAHDLDLWLKLGEIGQLANLPDTLLQYRLLTNSVSGRNPRDQRAEARLACEAAWRRRGLEGRFEATQPWRPTGDRSSQHHFMLQYGWWAFNSHQQWTAVIYGGKAILALPWSGGGWKLLIRALVKWGLGPLSKPSTGGWN
ncbi:MAG: glycosyltransferase family 2 protein [Nodosilinea sp.]